jgi:retron-type reverse transcriptase
MTVQDLYSQLCSYDNLELAYRRARKHKTLKPYVIEFGRNLEDNLLLLRTELLIHSYKPMPLKTFILCDPKTRKISKSDFRDRVIHHALCNIIEPLFEKGFIYDSYANRKGKGVLKALDRFDRFKMIVSRNNTLPCFVLKADIKHYFDMVDHEMLVGILRDKIGDVRVIWLIRTILANHTTKEQGKGMPLGNLTSQFFANVYLNELDQFVKHKLRARCYIRYVDDFVMLCKSKEALEYYKEEVSRFLREKLALSLHPEKSRIFPIYRGTDFLGLKVFAHHKVVQKKNIRKFQQKLGELCVQYDQGTASYDKIYDLLEGWCAYTKNANTCCLRRKILQPVELKFQGEMSSKEINRHLKKTLGVNSVLLE